LRPYFKDDKNVNFSKRGAGGAAGAAAANGEWGAGEDGEPGDFNAGVGMVHGLQDTQLTLDEKLARSEIQLYAGGRKIKGDDDEYDDGDDDEEEDVEEDEEDDEEDEEEDEEEDGEEDAGVRGRRTSEAAAGRQRRRAVFTAAGPVQEGDDGDWQDADSDDDLGGHSNEEEEEEEEDEEEEEEGDEEDEGMGRGAARWKSQTMMNARTGERKKTLMEMVGPGACFTPRHSTHSDPPSHDIVS